MHSLHEFCAKQLSDRLMQRRVVVLYDPLRELSPFIQELRGNPASVAARLAEYQGSFFALRAEVEPLVAVDSPEPLLVYVPGVEHDPKESVLMELKTAGLRYQPRLKTLARNVLREKYTEGVIDDLLKADGVTYQDLARMASRDGSSRPPSMLKVLFPHERETGSLIAAFLANGSRDNEIAAKGAVEELAKLVELKLGLSLEPKAQLAKSRQALLRYVLVSEFRSDLHCDAPGNLSTVPQPATKELTAAVRDIALRLRNYHSEVYASLADPIEADFQLNAASIDPSKLGSIDTFRFEERALLRYCTELIAAGRYESALQVVAEREHSYWLDRDMGRKAQWEAARRMAELGIAARDTNTLVEASPSEPAAMLSQYSEKHGWFHLDQAHRRMESWLANLDDDPEDDKALGVVRRAYDDACKRMASKFTAALRRSGWSVPGCLHQTRIYSEIIDPAPKPLAWLIVDALRFEMGVELAERLPGALEMTVRPVVAALPTITPVGMAALLPGASASFDVVEQAGKLGASIDGSFLPDLVSRKKYLAARAPTAVDLTLEETLTATRGKLAKKIAGAGLIVVRSQELDKIGEEGNEVLARQVMALVIDNVAKAIRRLAALRVENFVVTADHGHHFCQDKDESMRLDAPGGKTVELHRRCWIGHGGATPAGALRVSAAELGYRSDLEFVYPENTGVFKAGGDLAYHHGGTSLQELIVPVITLKMPTARTTTPPPDTIAILQVPELIASRALSAKLANLGTIAAKVRPVVMAGSREVAKAGLVVPDKADTLDAKSGTLTIAAGSQPSVGFFLTSDDATSVKVVVLDDATDKVLCQSAEIPVRLGM